MEIVVHVVVADGPIGLDEARVEVEELRPRVALQLLPHQAVHLGVAVPQRGGVLAAGEEGLQDRRGKIG